MALNAAEEETLESIKTWWNEQGRRLAAIVIVVFAGYTGWLLWQNSQSSAAMAASDVYEDILTLVTQDRGGEPVSEADRSQILGLADELMSSHQDTTYARYAALFAAQQHVANDDLAAAEAALRWILDNPNEGLFSEADPGLALTATLRLGRVLLAQNDPEAALALIGSVDPQGFEGGFSELRGDIYLSMNRFVDAREAYIAAQQAGSNSESLRLKLQSLPTDS